MTYRIEFEPKLDENGEWKEHIDEFIDFDFWYQNNASDNTSNSSLQ